MKKWVILFLVLCDPCRSFAEFVCSSEIRYSWKRTNVGEVTVAPTTTPAPEQTPSPSGTGEVNKLDVFWVSVEARGENEEAAKRVLVETVNRERARADGVCRELHENEAKCLATKFGSHISVMKLMSFEQRKAFEKTMQDDCERQAGQCLGSFATEPKCRETISAPAEGSKGAEGAKGKEKDAKKK